MNPLPQVRYPGRFIILGRDEENFVAIYGALGRNISSLDRRYVQEGNAIKAFQLQERGDRDLLEYTAFRFSRNHIIVANGRQIDMVQELSTGDTAGKRLLTDLADASSEPDNYKTPRITGAYVEGASGARAALHIVRSNGEGQDERLSWGRSAYFRGRKIYLHLHRRRYPSDSSFRGGAAAGRSFLWVRRRCCKSRLWSFRASCRGSGLPSRCNRLLQEVR